MRKFLLMPSRKVAWVAGLALIAWLLTPLAAFAHPLGNFTVNHYSRLEIYSDRVRVRYVLDMAEIPTFQAMPDIDRDGSGQVSQAENERYRLEQFEALRRGLRLEVNGAPVELQTATSELSFPPGQGDLKTLRLSGWLEAPLSSAVGQSATIEFEDHNFTDRIGWREIVVRPADGIRLDQSDAPMQEVSDELRAYPEDMLSSPLTQRQASLRFQIMFASSAPPLPGAAKPASSAAARTTDPFARLIHIEDLSASVALFALVAALGWGAAHAFTPGHGKALVGAYLVGARGTPRHAILLGLTVTATHTLGVYVLGFVTLFASRYILPEKLYPVLGVISGVMVVAIGGSLFVNRLRGQGGHAHAHDHHHPDHEHDHHHDHNHHHGPHRHTLIPPHPHTLPEGRPVNLRNLLALGISGGLVPCPSALVVMLAAIALDRVAFGLVLIVAFSLGLAGVLTGTGLLLVYAGRLFQHLSVSSRLVRLVSAGSALVMTVIGVAVTAQSLIQLKP